MLTGIAMIDRLRNCDGARILLATFVLLVLGACSSMRTIDVENAMRYDPPSSLHEGTLVQVETLGGEQLEFRATEVTGDGVGGEPGFIRYEDMRSLKAEKPPESKTDIWPVVGGIVGLALVVWLVGSADDVRVCSGTPCPGPEPSPQ